MMSLPSAPNVCGEKMATIVSDEEVCASAELSIEN